MPMRAFPFSQETRRKTGAGLGKAPPRATRDVVPLTEMETVGAAGLTVMIVFGSLGVDGTAVAGVVVAGVSLAGMALFGADPAPSLAAEVSDDPARSSFVTCGRNGSFVSNTSNATSWPSSA